MTNVIRQIRPRSGTDREAQIIYTVPAGVKTELSVYITSLVDLGGKGNGTVRLVRDGESPSEDNKLYMNRAIEPYDFVQIDKLHLSEGDSIYGGSADGNISFHVSGEEKSPILEENYLQSMIDLSDHIRNDQLVIDTIVTNNVV